jgi:hypothetical protein
MFRRAGVAGVAVAAATAIACAALPAQAATSTGWRQVISRHFGPAGAGSTFFAVTALSKTNAWALGGNIAGQGNPAKGVPVALHWNGRSWASTPVPSSVTDAIWKASAPAANDIWAVTFDGGWILHWNGAKWSVAKLIAGAGGFSGVTALSPTNVWVFGGNGGAHAGLGTWHFDGHTWKELTTGQAVGLDTAQALSAKDIWAIGGTKSPQSAIERYSGKSWYLANTKGIPAGQWQYAGVRALSDKDVWITATRHVTDRNVPYLLHYNGSAWTVFALPWGVGSGGTSNIINPVSDGHGGMWFTGETETAPAATFESDFYVVRRTVAGQWLRTKVGTVTSKGHSGVFLWGLGSIPGTGSVWGAGSSQSGNGQAVVWAFGKVGA